MHKEHVVGAKRGIHDQFTTPKALFMLEPEQVLLGSLNRDAESIGRYGVRTRRDTMHV
jgi:hypothetical protein